MGQQISSSEKQRCSTLTKIINLIETGNIMTLRQMKDDMGKETVFTTYMWTPLHAAAWFGRDEILDMLLEWKMFDVDA
jgi:hypothetical protein